MSSYKTDAGLEECRKTESGICDNGGSGGGGSGITSINGSTVAAQNITGGAGVNVSSIGGTTTITSTAPGTGTVTSVSASVPTFQSVSVATSTTTPAISITLSGQPLNIVSSGNSTIESSQSNVSAGVNAEAGYSLLNDTSDSMEIVMSGSNNTRRGIIRSAASAFGIDINAQGGSKTIKLQTNSATRVTVDDNGFSGILGVTTPALGSFTTVTASTPIAISSGGTNNNTASAAFNALAPVNVNKGGLIVWDGSTNAALVTSAANNGKVLTSDSTQSQGASWQTPSTGTGSVTSVGTSSSVTALTLGGGPITTTGTVALSFSGTPFPISQGGTGATTKAPAFDALQPMTTGGDLIYGGAAGTGTRLGNGTAGQVLTSAGTTLAPTWSTVTGTGTVTNIATTNTATSLTLSGGPITTTGTLALSYSGTAQPILNGGTGQITRTAAFNGLAPPTPAKGTLIVNDGTNFVNLPVGTDTYLLTANSAATDGVSWNSASAVLNSVVGFSAQTTSSQSITTSTATKVTWSSIVFDTNTGWSAANNWYVVPNTGYYFVSAQLAFATGFSSYDAQLYIVKNNSTTLLIGDEYHPAISAIGTTTVTGLFSLASGDTIQIQAYQNSGSSVALNADATITNFMVASVGGVSTAGGSGTVTSVATSNAATLLTVSGGPITTTGTLAFSYSGTPLPIVNGGSGQTTPTAAFNALAPSTSNGGLILANGSNSYINLPIGTSTYVLTSNGTTASWQPTVVGTVTSVSSSVPAFLSVNVSNPTTAPAVTITLSGTALPFTSGGTSAITTQGAINNLSQLTTNGDILYFDGSNSTRLARGTNTQVLTSTGSTINWATPSNTGGTVTSVGLNATGGSTPATSLTISGSPNPITTAGTLSVNYSGVAQPILYGGTGGTTATTGFNNLAPSTSSGGLIVGSGSNTYGNVGIGANSYILSSTGSTVQWIPQSGGGSSGPFIHTTISLALSSGSQTVNADIQIGAGGTPIVITLPTSASSPGAIIRVFKGTFSTITYPNIYIPIFVQANGTDYISGTTFQTSGLSTPGNYCQLASPNEEVTLVSNGAGVWGIANHYYPEKWRTDVSGANFLFGSVSNPTSGSGAVYTMFYRRVGANIEVRARYTQAGAGGPGNGTYLFRTPAEISGDTYQSSVSGNLFDTNFLFLSGGWNGSVIGNCSTQYTAASWIGTVNVYNSSTVCLVTAPDQSFNSNAQIPVSSNNGALSGTNVYYDFTYQVPLPMFCLIPPSSSQ